jgi:hypothetical protein
MVTQTRSACPGSRNGPARPAMGRASLAAPRRPEPRPGACRLRNGAKGRDAAWRCLLRDRATRAGCIWVARAAPEHVCQEGRSYCPSHAALSRARRPLARPACGGGSKLKFTLRNLVGVVCVRRMTKTSAEAFARAHAVWSQWLRHWHLTGDPRALRTADICKQIAEERRPPRYAALSAPSSPAPPLGFGLPPALVTAGLHRPDVHWQTSQGPDL